MKKSNELKKECLGKLVMSVSGLRGMTRALKRKYGIGNVEVECFVTKWKEKGKIKKTLGIILK